MKKLENLEIKIKSSDEIKDKDITNTVTRYNSRVEIQLKLEGLLKTLTSINRQKFQKIYYYHCLRLTMY